jgi:hypothetical protein
MQKFITVMGDVVVYRLREALRVKPLLAMFAALTDVCTDMNDVANTPDCHCYPPPTDVAR